MLVNAVLVIGACTMGAAIGLRRLLWFDEEMAVAPLAFCVVVAVGIGFAQYRSVFRRDRFATLLLAVLAMIGLIICLALLCLVVLALALGFGFAADGPWWMVATLVVVVGYLLFALVQNIRWNDSLDPRIRAGYCAGCGYDLRATPERCPECGCGRVARAR
jgi:hypothetical protein